MVASASQVDDALKTGTSLGYPDAVRRLHVLAPTFACSTNVATSTVLPQTRAETLIGS